VSNRRGATAPRSYAEFLPAILEQGQERPDGGNQPCLAVEEVIGAAETESGGNGPADKGSENGDDGDRIAPLGSPPRESTFRDEADEQAEDDPIENARRDSSTPSLASSTYRQYAWPPT
jgi:hypothetical protein